MDGVYLIHFESPLAHARHYIGWSKDIDKRLVHHKNGTGARIMRAVTLAGITWSVVRIWPGKDGNFERRIHSGGNKKRLCPVCNPEKYTNHLKE